MGYGSNLFGLVGSTVAVRSKPHRFTTYETDPFAQRVLSSMLLEQPESR